MKKNFIVLFVYIVTISLLLSGCNSMEFHDQLVDFSDPSIGYIAVSAQCLGAKNVMLIFKSPISEIPLSFNCNLPHQIFLLKAKPNNYYSVVSMTGYTSYSKITPSNELTHYYFSVRPGKVNYIGRLNIQFRNHKFEINFQGEPFDITELLKKYINLAQDDFQVCIAKNYHTVFTHIENLDLGPLIASPDVSKSYKGSNKVFTLLPKQLSLNSVNR